MPDRFAHKFSFADQFCNMLKPLGRAFVKFIGTHIEGLKIVSAEVSGISPKSLAWVVAVVRLMRVRTRGLLLCPTLD